MVKVLQNYRAKKEDHHKFSVTHHEPLHYSKEPLIEVTSLENEKKRVKKRKRLKGLTKVS